MEIHNKLRNYYVANGCKEIILARITVTQRNVDCKESFRRENHIRFDWR